MAETLRGGRSRPPRNHQMLETCLILNAAGLSLRQLGEHGIRDLERLAPASIEERLVLTAAERRRVRSLAGSDFVSRELGTARRLGVSLLHPGETTYPAALLELSDPPLVLYLDGRLDADSLPGVAVVGSRQASAYGRTVAAAYASAFAAAGAAVISGFARGIDATAHQAALDAGGTTVAVIGCGLDVDYPAGQEALRRAVRRRGALLSEFPFGARPDPQNFPRRNRVISGLSSAVVVVEARERSGALITARHAMEQGREVYAVPGPVFSPGSQGPHRLLRDGARPACSASDVLDELAARGGGQPLASRRDGPREGTVEHRVVEALSADPVHVDDLARRLGLSMGELMAVLSVLELRQAVRQHPGKRFSRR